MGRYVPPELEGVVSFNRASGKGHSLGSRASKLKSDGILTVRFECPFAIWCTNCDPEQIIGQGVRFNAEKKKVGNYYSTPIWSFRFKHTTCGKWIEVRTDPKNTEYVVVEGGRRRDTGTDKVLDGEIRIDSCAEEKTETDKDGGFGLIEKVAEDKAIANSQQARLDALRKRSERDWADPYEMNKRIRQDFRVGRRQRQADEKSGERLQEKFGLGVDLIEPLPEDGQRAKLMEYVVQNHNTASARSMFGMDSPDSGTAHEKERGKRGKKVNLTADKKLILHDSLKNNTRTKVDPFLQVNLGDEWQPVTRSVRNGEHDKVPSLKEDASVSSLPSVEKSQNLATALVGYDSD